MVQDKNTRQAVVDTVMKLLDCFRKSYLIEKDCSLRSQWCQVRLNSLNGVSLQILRFTISIPEWDPQICTRKAVLSCYLHRKLGLGRFNRQSDFLQVGRYEVSTPLKQESYPSSSAFALTQSPT